MNKLVYDGEQLPPRLPDAEVMELFKRYSEGDLKARAKIIAHNISLTVTIAKKYSIIGLTDDDIVQIGNIGLIKAVDSFDWKRGVPFSKYAGIYIENEIRGEERYSKCRSKEYSMENFIAEDLTVEDTLFDSSNIILDYEDEETLKIIFGILETMNKRDRLIVSLRFGFLDGEPLTEEEVAERLQISRSYVSLLLNRVLGRIRMQLYTDGLMESPTVDSKFSRKRQKNE